MNSKIKKLHVIVISTSEKKKLRSQGRSPFEFLHTCHGIINKLVVMATNDKCRQSALGDLIEETFKSLAIAGTL